MGQQGYRLTYALNNIFSLDAVWIDVTGGPTIGGFLGVEIPIQLLAKIANKPRVKNVTEHRRRRPTRAKLVKNDPSLSPTIIPVKSNKHRTTRQSIH